VSTLYELGAQDIEGKPRTLAEFKDKVLLVVNVASRCGFTPQYAGLEELWRKYRDRGLVVLGFPCNQFGAQEPGDEAAIGEFCSSKYDVTFPMFSKVEVNGKNTHPVYRYLKKASPGVLGSEGIKWNFTKFLVDAKGNVVARYASVTKPEKIAADIESLLASVQ
jgi:glutathione peroxidase